LGKTEVSWQKEKPENDSYFLRKTQALPLPYPRNRLSGALRLIAGKHDRIRDPRVNPGKKGGLRRPIRAFFEHRRGKTSPVFYPIDSGRVLLQSLNLGEVVGGAGGGRRIERREERRRETDKGGESATLSRTLLTT